MKPIKVFHQSKGAIHMSLEILKEKGYLVKIVWESEFIKNKEKIIEDCKEFLNS